MSVKKGDRWLFIHTQIISMEQSVGYKIACFLYRLSEDAGSYS